MRERSGRPSPKRLLSACPSYPSRTLPEHGRTNASSPRDGHRRHLLQGEGPKALAQWYGRHLGIDIEDTVALFTWRSGKDGKAKGATVWSIFPSETPCTGPEERPVL